MLPGTIRGATVRSDTIRGADIIAAVRASGIATVVALPDIVTSDDLLRC